MRRGGTATADRRSPDASVTTARGERVVLEIVPRRAFAVAVDWPGWTRAGRDEDEALDALLRAGPRYAAALGATDVPFVPPVDRAGLVVVDRLPGTSGTEFGAPSVPLPADEAPLGPPDLERQAAILRASWTAFEEAAERHAGDALRTGPRGGGRDLPRIIEHVRGADEGYLVQLGSRPARLPAGPRAPAALPEAAVVEVAWGEASAVAALAALHDAALAALRARALGQPVEHPSRTARPWTPRRYVRRAAWHWLDHAWEIEDRAIRAGP
jgi:hypothetical protein